MTATEAVMEVEAPHIRCLQFVVKRGSLFFRREFCRRRMCMVPETAAAEADGA